MEGVVCAVLILAMFAKSEAAWCVCKGDMPEATLQKTIDYACGAGADCTQILQNGPCFNPNTVQAHCSYAANSYFQKNGQNPQACNFAGTALTSNTDPSYTGCSYPASASGAGTTATGTTNTYSPPSTFGIGPSGNSMTDMNHSPTISSPAILAILSFSLMLLLFRP